MGLKYLFSAHLSTYLSTHHTKLFFKFLVFTGVLLKYLCKWGNLNVWLFICLSFHLQWPLKLLVEGWATHPEGVYSRRLDIHAKDAWWQVARILLSLVPKYDHTLCNLFCLASFPTKQKTKRTLCWGVYLVNISGRRQTLSSTHSLQITTQSSQFITASSALELLDLELSRWSFSIAKCSCQSCFLNSEILSPASVYVLAFLTSHPCEMKSLLFTTNKKGALSSLGLHYENAGQMVVTHSAFNVMNSTKIAINIYSNWFFDRLSIMFRAYSFYNFF